MDQDTELRILDMEDRLEDMIVRMNALTTRMNSLVPSNVYRVDKNHLLSSLEVFENSRTELYDYLRAIHDGLLDVAEFAESPDTDTLTNTLEEDADRFYDAIFADQVHIDSYDDLAHLQSQ